MRRRWKESRTEGKKDWALWLLAAKRPGLPGASFEALRNIRLITETSSLLLEQRDHKKLTVSGAFGQLQCGVINCLRTKVISYNFKGTAGEDILRCAQSVCCVFCLVRITLPSSYYFCWLIATVLLLNLQCIVFLHWRSVMTVWRVVSNGVHWEALVGSMSWSWIIHWTVCSHTHGFVTPNQTIKYKGLCI